jgi:hypothetical protein
MTVILSDGTLKRLERLFVDADRAGVVDLLVNQCGSNLPFCESSTPTSLERIRFAVLKLSDGNIAKLQEAVQLAKADWRDLLMAAGFGEDLTAHLTWWPD